MRAIRVLVASHCPAPARAPQSLSRLRALFCALAMAGALSSHQTFVFASATSTATPTASGTGSAANSSREFVRDFASDGCTMFSEGTRQDPELWADCCLEHDLRYWAGGMRSQQDRADLRLRDCVSERAGAEMGRLMYFGVRAGHLSPVKIPSGRWGNAWNRPGWIALTDPEIREIEARLQRYLIPREIELRLLESLRHD